MTGCCHSTPRHLVTRNTSTRQPCRPPPQVHDAYFVDLFVRSSNVVAISMYEKLGYSVYRRVLGYYSGEEDAFDMRKAMKRDVAKASVVPLGRPVRPEELEYD